jgi:hypothetical protein
MVKIRDYQAVTVLEECARTELDGASLLTGPRDVAGQFSLEYLAAALLRGAEAIEQCESENSVTRNVAGLCCILESKAADSMFSGEVVADMFNTVLSGHSAESTASKFL